MAMGVTVRDVDHGYRDLKRRVFGAAKPRIAIGLLAGATGHAGDPHQDSDKLTLLDVGIINEFGGIDKNGNEHPPARSFIREWFDEDEALLREKLVVLMQSVVSEKRTKEQVLNLIGQFAVGRCQERISRGIEPPNAPSTIARKGSSKPLIDHGQLRAGLTYDLRDA